MLIYTFATTTMFTSTIAQYNSRGPTSNKHGPGCTGDDETDEWTDDENENDESDDEEYDSDENDDFDFDSDDDFDDDSDDDFINATDEDSYNDDTSTPPSFTSNITFNTFPPCSVTFTNHYDIHLQPIRNPIRRPTTFPLRLSEHVHPHPTQFTFLRVNDTAILCMNTKQLKMFVLAVMCYKVTRWGIRLIDRWFDG